MGLGFPFWVSGSSPCPYGFGLVLAEETYRRRFATQRQPAITIANLDFVSTLIDDLLLLLLWTCVDLHVVLCCVVVL